MKNKIILAASFGLFLFAVYALVNNINHAEHELYYVEDFLEQADFSSQASLDGAGNSHSKRGRGNSYGNSGESGLLVSVPSVQKSRVISSTVPNGGFSSSVLSAPSSGRVAKSGTSPLSQGMSAGLLLAGSGSKKGSGVGGSSGTFAAFGTAALPSGGTPSINAPTAPADNGDIIIDPGGDPDPDSQIPVGGGLYLLLAFAFGYFLRLRGLKSNR